MTRRDHLSTTGDPLGGTVRRTVLPGGLRVLSEAIPTVRSASIGVWVDAGSRDEPPELAGASHFLEHLLFKGTTRRSAMEISAAIEAVGGETNAYTAKEHTCYYARVLDTVAPLAVDVLCDLIHDSRLAPHDVETERGVIIDEIAMQLDEPSEQVHEAFNSVLFGDHPLGRDIAGNMQTVQELTRRQIYDFYKSHYTAPHLVVAAAGNVDHDQIVGLVRDGLGPLVDDEAAAPAPLRSETAPIAPVDPQTVVAVKDTEQAHLVLGCRALRRRDERRFALEVLNQVLGGGMSSRLFQSIREDRGLAYSVYSFVSHFAETGQFGVYAACTPAHAHQVLDLVRGELDRAATGGLTAEEVTRGRSMAKGALVLALEDTGSRMSRLGRGELLFGDQLSVDDILGCLDAVTVDDVAEVAAEILGRPMSLAVAGPFTDTDFTGI